MSHPLPIVLASSSPYRKALLEKLGLSFSCQSPDIDEARLADESPRQLVARLAAAKAKALKEAFPAHLIIGSDQVAVLDNDSAILGKPGNKDNAIAQLQRCSGQTVTFLTGLSLYNSKSDRIDTLVEPYEVGFRTLSEREIESYVDKEEPYNCAGSFKSEGLGIALFDYLHGDDPNALIGLPLIRLLQLLRQQGADVLA
ncbi:Maf family protein [Aliidiomarina soli]|uniref:7-methyl-GTP pyrophosphatase n=1 Tax=Aliidiomarina soli TaxID=1928574 RepID=A0A432WMI2_9GAMM|nr:nucleoside triphosphate pyrophosphatase [Aliidiomarina soli]RUO35016.1 septum formation inhibitor Maf [Aliidiomarina soli]